MICDTTFREYGLPSLPMNQAVPPIKYLRALFFTSMSSEYSARAMFVIVVVKPMLSLGLFCQASCTSSVNSWRDVKIYPGQRQAFLHSYTLPSWLLQSSYHHLLLEAMIHTSRPSFDGLCNHLWAWPGRRFFESSWSLWWWVHSINNLLSLVAKQQPALQHDANQLSVMQWDLYQHGQVLYLCHRPRCPRSERSLAGSTWSTSYATDNMLGMTFLCWCSLFFLEISHVISIFDLSVDIYGFL